MKGVWKWIALAAGLFLLMACVGVAAAVGFGGRFLMMGRGFQQRMPFLPGQGPLPGFGHDYGMWMMPGRWLVGLGIGLFILVLLVLVGVGLYLALRKRPQVAAPVQVSAPTSTSEPSVTSVPAAPVTTPCSHCGQPVQAGWVACPYCGEKT